MAISANELRIGNWLRFNNNIMPVDNIRVNARLFASLAGGRSIDEMKPVECDGFGVHGSPINGIVTSVTIN